MADDRFSIAFPMWTIATVLPEVHYITVGLPKNGTGCAVFLQRLQAAQFLARIPNQDYKVIAIEAAPNLLALLDILDTKGFTHVAFNPNFSESRAVTIDDLRGQLNAHRSSRRN